MASSRLKPILIFSAIIVGLALWFADRKGPEKKIEAKTPQSGSQAVTRIDWKIYRDSLINSNAELSGNPEFKRLYNGLKSEKIEPGVYDSIAAEFLKARLPMAAASIYLLKAQHTTLAIDWATSAETFYRAAHFSAGSFSAIAMSESVAGFKKACDLDPTNLKFKTQLGASIVESSGNPMEGITLLREVVAQDSTYVDAHIQLALFAIQSAQYDKAISRLKRVIKMRPDVVVAYLYMGQAYQQSGNISEAVSSLEKYKSEINDPALRDEVQKYIDQLKKSSNS